MPKYDMTASVELYTEIEPEGELRQDDIPNFTDESAFIAESLRFNGEVAFQIEAANEDTAIDRARQLLYDVSFYSHNGIEFEVENCEIDNVTEVEPEMDKEKAKEIIRVWLMTQTEKLDPVLVAALQFILALL